MSDQCEQSGPRGQCHHPKVDGSDFCGRHSNEADRITGYRLSNPELRERVERHGSVNPSSVQNEIALLRGLIEDRLELVTGPAERMSAFLSVTPQVVSLVKCLETMHKLERQSSVVLGKEALAGLQKKIILILTNELSEVEDYESIVDRVASQIAQAIAGARNPTT